MKDDQPKDSNTNNTLSENNITVISDYLESEGEITSFLTFDWSEV